MPLSKKGFYPLRIADNRAASSSGSPEFGEDAGEAGSGFEVGLGGGGSAAAFDEEGAEAEALSGTAVPGGQGSGLFAEGEGHDASRS